MKSKSKKLKIIYIKPNDSSFINGDQKIFEKYYQVNPFLLSQLKGNFHYALMNIKLFMLLISKVFTKNVIFIAWFADYHTAIMTLAAKLTNKRSIILIGGQEAVCYHELNKGVYRKKIRGEFVKFSLRKASLIIANHKSLVYHENSYYNKENPHIDGIKYYVNNLKTDIKIVSNGIDPSRFVRNYDIKKIESLILTVGTMNQIGDFYNKGFDLFIKVARMNPNLQFILIGLNPNFLDWTEKNYQYSTISNLKIIPSFCPSDMLNEIYNKAKIFVQASITEGMPNTLSEAMLLECIPVGSNINGIPDAIGETGIIIQQRDEYVLSNAINAALKLNTGKLARERVIELFTLKIREEKLLQILKTFD